MTLDFGLQIKINIENGKKKQIKQTGAECVVGVFLKVSHACQDSMQRIRWSTVLERRRSELLRAQERPATLILTVISGLRITRARHVYNRDAETGN